MHISLRNIDKSYQKNKLVIKKVNLEIFEDEFLVLVGPSGSGKTTILRMIAGLEEITGGKLYIDDLLQNDKDPSTRNLSFVFQNYALLPNLTVYENILFGLLNLKISKLEKKRMVESIAKKLSLYDKMGSYPRQLSGGQRQRVALARALVDEKKLVLFDEPLSNLDAVLRDGMRKELITYHNLFKVTSIYVTHDQIEAMSLASRVVVLIDGVVSQVGTPYQLYNHPNNLDVATFIGSPTANILKTTFNGEELVCGDLTFKLNNTQQHQLEKHLNETVYYMIRPHDVKVFDSKEDNCFEAKFVFEENYGNNKLIHLEINGNPLQAIVENDWVLTDKIYVDISNNPYFFNQDRKRVTENKFDQVIFNEVTVSDSILRELDNYGYKVSFDLNDKNDLSLVIEKTNDNYFNLIHKDEIIKINNLSHIFKHIVYIK